MKTPVSRRAFTVTELLVVIAVIALLAALALPALMASRRRSQQTTCLSNVRSLGAALLLYTQDFDGTYPPPTQVTFDASNVSHQQGGATWCDLLVPYVKGAFPRCPVAESPEVSTKAVDECGYALNTNLGENLATQKGSYVVGGRADAVVTLTSLTISLLEARIGVLSTNDTDHYDDPDYKNMVKGAVRHNGGANYAFLDGHARWHRPGDFVIKCDGVKPCFEQ